MIALTDNARLKVGDRVKVRIEIRVDRDMEYVHLKDMRAAGFEPENVLSRYKWQEGLGYYESTGDAATNFFIDWLPKGTYVFEYPMRAQLKGNFSNGITAMQCMYAPEFASHSEGIRLTIEEQSKVITYQKQIFVGFGNTIIYAGRFLLNHKKLPALFWY